MGRRERDPPERAPGADRARIDAGERPEPGRARLPVRYGLPAGRWVLLAAVLGSALAFVDTTVVNVALPHIGAELRAGAAGLQWTVNGYALSLSSLLLLGGSLGDRFGRRRVFVVGAGWFGAASLLCAVATRIELLVAARIVQGVGGALLVPGALALIETEFDPRDRARAIGAWSGLGGLAGAVGPFIGGWLVQVSSWRLVFLVNVPLAAAAIVVATRHVPESRGDASAAHRLDVPGALLAVGALAGLAYAFTAWPAAGARSARVTGPMLLGIAATIGFVASERRSDHPMVPLALFASRAFTAANLATLAVYAALGGVLFLLVLDLQVVAGFGPLAAGTALLPITALMLLLSPGAGALAQRFGSRLPMTVGPLICASALLLLARVGRDATYVRTVLPGVVVLGLGLSLTVAPLTATALGALDERHAGIASGINNAVARAAGLLAIAVLPVVSGLGRGSLTDPAALASTYPHAMWWCASLMMAAAGIALVGIPAGPTPPYHRR